MNTEELIEKCRLTRDEIYQIYDKLHRENPHWSQIHSQRDADIEIAEAQLRKAIPIIQKIESKAKREPVEFTARTDAEEDDDRRDDD